MDAIQLRQSLAEAGIEMTPDEVRRVSPRRLRTILLRHRDNLVREIAEIEAEEAEFAAEIHWMFPDIPADFDVFAPANVQAIQKRLSERAARLEGGCA